MASRRNADGSITVGILKDEPKKVEPKEESPVKTETPKMGKKTKRVGE